MYRQTIVFSSFEAPELNSLSNTFCNHDGALRVGCKYDGVLNSILPPVCIQAGWHVWKKVAGSMMANNNVLSMNS